MVIIGMIAVVAALGLFLFLQGAMLNVVTYGFSGKPSMFGFIMVFIGGIVLYLAFKNSPIHIFIQ